MSDYYEAHLQNPDILVPYRGTEKDPLRPVRGLVPVWVRTRSLRESVRGIETPDGSHASSILMQLVYGLYASATVAGRDYDERLQNTADLFVRASHMTPGVESDVSVTNALEETLVHGMTKLLFVHDGPKRISDLHARIAQADPEAGTTFLRSVYGHLGIMMQRLHELGAADPPAHTRRPEFLQILHVAKWFRKSLLSSGAPITQTVSTPEEEIMTVYLAESLSLDKSQLRGVQRMLEASWKKRRLDPVSSVLQGFWAVKTTKTIEVVETHLSTDKSLREVVMTTTGVIFSESS